MGLKFRVKEYKDLPDDVYRAKLKNVEKKAGEHGDYLMFTFEVIDDAEYAGTVINGLASADVTIGNKTYKWIVALNGGKEFDADEVGDIETFKGATVKIVVVHKAQGDNNYARIESVLPDKKKKVVVEEVDEAPAPAKKSAPEAEKPAAKPAAKKDDDEDEFI